MTFVFGGVSCDMSCDLSHDLTFRDGVVHC